ncbi:hypothetical protein L1N85_10505 [Paenibacillus alkaliterrae]|uniref:hypothetical protein n=1 Tax=Paenibacillus alkaliterrae TaxID=320909 RepID=UPI001F4427D4|nr:hypothetical protein [Paenibacillus alkaliterrae]MCF2938867.1 hypothetical protein [Paenibacillus alkaliterrae]
MSSNLKMKVRSVKSKSKTTSRARVSYSSCKYKDDHKSCGHKHKQDPAVEGVQEAGKELSDIFKQLKNENVAEKLVKAIRCRDARAVQSLLDCDCRVVDFFCTHDKDCVRICCAFGRYKDVTVTFDICIKRVEDPCGRKYWY